METVECPYCCSRANLESSKKIYGGRDFGLVYICANYPTCDAYVGVHKGTCKPLGRLADFELRRWKNKAHAAFDPLWRIGLDKKLSEGHSRSYIRNKAYKWLADQLGMATKDCHIGMFDVDLCKAVVEICHRYPSV